ncbi:MAG: AAA family ATPase [Gammaproteobacteria bacterium]|nr:AAA family ATPase [Gammaproteobacteria bacterium]
MYLEHFKFNELPFILTPDTNYFCDLKGHQEALDTLLFSLRNGEGFIKIIGEVGAGKTLLCRKLLDSLDETFFTAWIPNPDLTPLELRRALARELKIDLTVLPDQHELLTAINHRLLELHSAGKQVVLLLDEAQALSDESLEAIRLLTNLETSKKKLLQVVLFGQPELDEKLDLSHLRQLKQRISFAYYLPKLSREELDTYLFHRLATAGNTRFNLFSKKSRDLLYRASRGTPRLVNVLCHKALLIAYGKGQQMITRRMMKMAVYDTEAALFSPFRFILLVIVGLIGLAGLLLFWHLMQGTF